MKKKGGKMTVRVLLFIAIVQGIIIIYQAVKIIKQGNNSTDKETDDISFNDICLAFEKNNYNIENIKKLSKDNLVEHIRTFKLQLQNEEYERAERRVVENMKSFLYELWRLNTEDNDETAKNLLILLNNTLRLRISSDNDILFNDEIKKHFSTPDNIEEGVRLTVLSPAVFFKDDIIIKGEAR